MRFLRFASSWLTVFILSLLLSLTLTGTLAAQEASSTAPDPEATKLAVKLLATFESVDQNVQDPDFLALFDADPNLTRRAFMALYELYQSETNTEQAAQIESLLDEFALLADSEFGDNIPNLILDGVSADSPHVEALIERYLAFLRLEEKNSPRLSAQRLKQYGPYSDTYAIVQSPYDLPNGLFEAMTPIWKSEARITVAFLLENFGLVGQEVDYFPKSVARLKEIAKKNGLGGNFSEVLEGPAMDRVLSDLDFIIDIEAGLVDQTREILKSLEGDDQLYATRLAMAYLATSRMATKQARLEISKSMLEGAKQELAQDTKTSSRHLVLAYALRTADYRQRRSEGFEPTNDQVIAEFQTAWSALEGYQPMESFGVDSGWLEGRHATRFWIDELVRLPSGQEPSFQMIGEDWEAWWKQTLTRQDRPEISARETLLSQGQNLESFYTLASAYFDQLTYRWVKFPKYLVDPKELEWAKTALSQLPDSVDWVVEAGTSDGFPPYNVASAGLIPEMMSRCELASARAPGLTTQARLTLLEESLSAARKGTQPSSQADQLIRIGIEFKKLGEDERAVACWNETVALTDKVPLAEPAFQALLWLAREYFDRKDYEKASYYADLATQKLEVVSPLIGVRSTEAQKWSQELATITSLAAKAFIATDAPEKALAAITRGQQLQAAALQVEGSPALKSDGDALRRQQQSVVSATEQVAKLESQPASAKRDELLVQTRALLADSKADFLIKSRELRQKHSAIYSQALKFDPLDLPGLQRDLPADVAVLQYFPTEDTLYTFLVTKESFRLRSVAIADTALNGLVGTFLRDIRRHSAGDTKTTDGARKLHDILIAPSAEDLVGKSTIVLIPTGRLHGLPFACLADEQNKPLVEKWRLVELAKSSDLQRLSKEAGGPIESLVAFANATQDLPAASAEGKKIASMFSGSKLFEKAEATRANFFAFGGGAQVLHLATHGEWNLDDSLKNYLALAGSEKVAQEEIFQLPLEDTSMVVLSACNTAVGEGGQSGYVASLAEAFWLAGSRSVLASLWSVNDESTSLLMETFYTRLRAGDDKAEALRTAQLAVRAKEGFEHPYYWSGFVLFGERR